tara:strand:+ start:268 stop:456 length:189 start_codon:yes stop_codon:yes gene_type:complete
MELQKARLQENKAYEEADAATHDAKNYREDVSFLTKETNRLADEILVAQNLAGELEDQLRKS